MDERVDKRVNELLHDLHDLADRLLLEDESSLVRRAAYLIEGIKRDAEERAKTKGDPRFHALLTEIGDLHDRKQADYGRDNDTFANVRASEQFGMTAWVGAMLRANDKMVRIQQFARKGVLANESVEDSLLDIAVYALIALVLYREQSQSQSPPSQ